MFYPVYWEIYDISEEDYSPSECGGYEYFTSHKEAQTFCDSHNTHSRKWVTYFSYVMDPIRNLPPNPNPSNSHYIHQEFYR